MGLSQVVMIITATPLTAKVFASYGQLLAAKGATPQRCEFAAHMQNLRTWARPNLTFMKVAVAGLPAAIDSLERHPWSNQTFIPLNGTRHLVVVCPSTSKGEPLLSKIRAFEASGSQAINYDANVWHAPRIALGGTGELIMFRWDDGSKGDTELRRLEFPITIQRSR